jgi:ribosomal protein S18 acetylase RimI-like enzyme
MEENIIISKATLKDIHKLQKISRDTFIETFASVNSEENIKKYLEDCLSVEVLTGELNNSNSQFYLAILEDDVTGYLKVNFREAQTELKDQNTLEIERIYVSKKYHGKSMGQLLYEKAVQVAAELRADFLWLGVWEKNARAISFYKRNGLIEFDKHIFLLGDDAQTDIMMKKELIVKKPFL